MIFYEVGMKEKYVNYFMGIAVATANLSYCARKKVGAILVKDNNIISIGYNGTLPNEDNCCEDCEGKTKSSVIHAELNCLTKVCKSTNSSQGASLFVTLSPCIACSTIIVASGVHSVYYLEEYRDMSGVELLKTHGIECIKL